MIGLWGPSTTYGAEFHRTHVAFAVTLSELLAAGERLRRSGVTCRDFGGKETDEPSVIGWMPSAQLYFRDCDGHSVEFIALLMIPHTQSLLDHCPSGAKRGNQSISLFSLSCWLRSFVLSGCSYLPCRWFYLSELADKLRRPRDCKPASPSRPLELTASQRTFRVDHMTK